MYELRVRRSFDAAHRLYGYEGKCARMHGHTWTVEAVVAASQLDERGMVCDFFDVKEALDKALAPFDHVVINEVAPFHETSPTSENLARHLFDLVSAALAAKLPTAARVAEVRVSESPGSSASYRG